MDINRRGFLFGLGALIAAPAIVRANIIMPIKVIELPAPLYPGELLLPDRDLAFWVRELKLDVARSLFVPPHLLSSRRYVS